jgi:hypothetical protein
MFVVAVYAKCRFCFDESFLSASFQQSAFGYQESKGFHWSLLTADR